MLVGHSSSRGILIGDTAMDAPNAVYGYFAGEGGVSIAVEKGDMKTLHQLQDRHEKADRQEDGKNSIARVFGPALAMLAASVMVWVFFGFVNFLGAMVFSVIAYFPLMVILYARRLRYRTDALRQQFRRNHGCEHACIKLLSRIRRSGETDLFLLTLQNLKSSPIYDSECGTVYSGYAITLAAVLGLLISDVVNIGLWRSAAVLFATVVAIVILILMPWNPYKRLQRPAVAQPGEREYQLGMAVMEAFLRECAEKDITN